MDRRTFITACGAAALTALAGCQKEQKAEETPEEAPAPEEAPVPEEAPATEINARIAALKGPTAMGLVKFMEEAPAGVSFEILAAPDELTPKIVQGEVDVAALPANLASVLYNKTQGGVRVIAVNTLGVIYICEKGGTIASVADLAGRTIYASGKGATPEFALAYVLEANGLTPGTDVTIEWKSEHTECVAALEADPAGVAMLPQPFVTTAAMKDDAIRVALDLTKEWEAAAGGASAMITGVHIARAEYAEEHADELRAIIDAAAESAAFVNSNVAEAAQLIEKYDIVPAKVAEKALLACNIVCITGEEMKAKLSGYLDVLFARNPESVGGALPADDFYFI